MLQETVKYFINKMAKFLGMSGERKETRLATRLATRLKYSGTHTDQQRGLKK
jgi:hypothetical protein